MKEILKEIEKTVNLHGDRASFDTWGNDTRTEQFRFLMENIVKHGYNYFEGEKGNYLVSFHCGHSGMGGMDMGSPDSITVAKLNKYPNN